MQFIVNKEKNQIEEKSQKKKSILQKELSAKEVLITVGISCTFIAYGFLFIYPKYTQYKSAVDNLNNIESQISTYESKISQMPVLENELSELNKEINRKSKILSHNMEDGMFFIGLSNLMHDLGVELVNYTTEEYIKYDTFYALPTSITLRGNYNNVKSIMNYMENQKNMTQILNYNIDSYIEEITEEDIILDADGNEVIVENKTTPKNEGIVEGTFKFIIYSSENPADELNNSDSSKWKPGKNNPFKSTI